MGGGGASKHAIVTIHGSRPRAYQTVTTDGRARRFAAVGAQHRNAASVGGRAKFSQGPRQDGVGIARCLRRLKHLSQDGPAFVRGAETARDPDVTLAINGESTGAIGRLESFDLARTRIGCREAAHPIADGIPDPDPVLLVNPEMEWPGELAGIFFGVAGLVHKQQLPFGGIAFGHINHLRGRRGTKRALNSVSCLLLLMLVRIRHLLNVVISQYG
jgi:hypothetical protein